MKNKINEIILDIINNGHDSRVVFDYLRNGDWDKILMADECSDTKSEVCERLDAPTQYEDIKRAWHLGTLKFSEWLVAYVDSEVDYIYDMNSERPDQF